MSADSDNIGRVPFSLHLVANIGAGVLARHGDKFVSAAIEQLVDRWLYATDSAEEDELKDRIYHLVYPED